MPLKSRQICRLGVAGSGGPAAARHVSICVRSFRSPPFPPTMPRPRRGAYQPRPDDAFTVQRGKRSACSSIARPCSSTSYWTVRAPGCARVSPWVPAGQDDEPSLEGSCGDRAGPGAVRFAAGGVLLTTSNATMAPRPRIFVIGTMVLGARNPAEGAPGWRRR